MNRKQKLKKNIASSLTNRLFIVISGLILPRFILNAYGSEVNGLVSSLNQFLSIIVFLDLGLGSVVQSALYKPLVDRDNGKISEVLTAAKNYFQKVAYVLIAYIILLIIFYPMIINNSLDFLSTAFLIIALSISLFSQYYFGIVYEFLLNADQKSYLQYNIESLVVVLNLVISIPLIISGFSIQFVKLIAGLIYLIRPIYLSYYVAKNYDISTDITLKKDPIPQKWNGMAQHIAFSAQNSVDTIVLTLFSTLETVSIYSIYNMVIQGMKLVVTSLSTGLKAYFGDMLFTENNEEMNSLFSEVEWTVHNIVIFLYSMTAVLILPFVRIYTLGIHDTDYYVPIFAILFVLSGLAYSIRTPYQTLVFSAGHFKQTQSSSMVELVINVVLSLLLTIRFGMVGVAIGTILANSYRIIYLVYYLNRNILFRSFRYFIKQIIADICSFLIIFLTGTYIVSNFHINSFYDFFLVAVLCSMVSLLIIFIVNVILYRNKTFIYIKSFIE